MRKILALALGFLGIAFGSAQAQQAIQAIPQHLDAAVATQSSTAAVNTALTLTIPAVAGQFAYVTNIALGLCNDATGTATANDAVTSTNLNGFSAQLGVVVTASACGTPLVLPFVNGFKSAAAGTATTIVIAQPGAHTAAIGSVSYYYGF